jgi:hypothetical protein
MRKIRVNTKNSKVINGQLFITELKAISIKIKDLAERINWHQKVFHPTLGKMLSYSGKYIR